MKMTKKRKQLQDDLKVTRGYCTFREEAIHGALKEALDLS